MRILIGLAALLLAYATGSLALVTAGPAFGAGVVESVAGQARGMVFTVGAAAITVGLVWVAMRSFVRPAR
jgi:hypothetical protein